MRTHLMRRLFAGLIALFATSATAFAWEAPYVEEGIGRCMAAAKKMKDVSGFGARSDGICLIGGFMEDEGEMTWKCKLKGGKEYIFVASGDTDVKDLDLEAWEGETLIARDALDDNVPIVGLTVEADCDVTMKLKLADAPGGGQKHFTVMIMLEAAGTGGSLGQLERVAKQLNDACAGITDKGDLEFDQAQNTICLAAALLEDGADRSFNRTFSKDRNYIMIGAGDDACVDLDLEVLHDDKVISKDEATDASPVAGIEVSDANVRCTVKMIMHDSKKPSFCVVAILTSK